MGEGNLLAVARPLTVALAALALVAAAAEARAQGVAYRERWGYLQLESRRAQVRELLIGRDQTTHERIAARLIEPDAGNPVTSVAAALADLRGATMDPAFLLRTAVGAFLLPEVCDPDASNEVCRTMNVSLFVPYAVGQPAPVTFAIEVTDATGKVVHQQDVSQNTGEQDVRMARPTAKVPCGELADGAYRLMVRTVLDGNGPREHDPVCEWTFHVLRGYQHRAEQAMQRVGEVEASLSVADRAWLLGLRGDVQRAYFGEPFAVVSDAVQDLARLERGLANVADKRAVAADLIGDARLALPVGAGLPLQCVLRRAAGERRPLVVIVGGAPALDAHGNRPTSPATHDPHWLARELSTFGVRERWHVAFLESPGVGRDFAPALREALPLLGQLCGNPDGKPLLVCEREAAAIVGLRIGDYRAIVSGVALIGAGAMSAPALLANGALPIRVASAKGFGEDALTRMLDFVNLQQGKPEWRGDVAWLSKTRPAWPFALSSLADELTAFGRQLFPDKD